MTACSYQQYGSQLAKEVAAVPPWQRALAATVGERYYLHSGQAMTGNPPSAWAKPLNELDSPQYS